MESKSLCVLCCSRTPGQSSVLSWWMRTTVKGHAKRVKQKTAGGRWLRFSYRIGEENDSVIADTLVALFMKVTEKVLKINVCGI